MRRYRILTAVALILLPPLARGFWFYRGLYQPTDPIELPSFEEISIATPPLVEPVAREVEATEALPKTVLFDFEHGNQFQLDELAALTSALDAQGASIELVGSSFEFDALSLSDRFRYASAYVVIAPLTAFSDSEIREVARFVDRGGRLLVIADPTRGQVTNASNMLDATWEAPNGQITPLDGYLDPYFQEVYLEAESVPIFSKLARHGSVNALDD